MAYSFIPPGGGSFGGTLGGFGSLGLGAGLMNAMASGLNLAGGFRKYQNQNILDQYQIPAQAAQATQQMWDADFGTRRAQGAIPDFERLLRMSAQPGQIYDQQGNPVMQMPVGQEAQVYPQTQAFTGAVQQNTINGRPPIGVATPPALGPYMSSPQSMQQFDPASMLRSYYQQQ